MGSLCESIQKGASIRASSARRKVPSKAGKRFRRRCGGKAASGIKATRRRQFCSARVVQAESALAARDGGKSAMTKAILAAAPSASRRLTRVQCSSKNTTATTTCSKASGNKIITIERP